MMRVVMTFTPVTRHQMSSVSSNLRQNPSRGEVGDDLSYLDILETLCTVHYWCTGVQYSTW